MTKLLEQIYSYFSMFSYWTLPPGIEAVLIDKARLGYILATHGASLFTHPRLRANRELKDLHAGQRCFILGNGPSIAHEDLTLLKNEICISVSNFYKHPSYPIIRPRYHCVPNIGPPHTTAGIISWFTEMHEQTLDATLLLGFRQKRTVRANDLFPGRKTYYFLMEAVRPALDRRVQDITRNILNPQSVPVMAMIIALYMGFREIYLLGVDHDNFKTGTYHYFFDRKEAVLQDPFVSTSGATTNPRLEDFIAAQKLWQQYLLVNAAAKQKGALIINISRGSYLDVFSFDVLEHVLADRRGQP